jgi:hypothetical protein
VIAGTLNAGQTSGSVSASGLSIVGGSGNSFSVDSLTGTFKLGVGPTVDLSGSGIEHLASQAGTLRIFLTLANLADPLSALDFKDAFSGTLASSLSGTRDLVRVHLGLTPFATQVPLFDSGQVPSAAADPSCGASGTSVTCDFTGSVAAVPNDPYAVTELVTLTFGGNGNTLNKSGSFSNTLKASVTSIPEPGTAAMLVSALLGVCVGFRRRRSRQI